MIDAGGSVRPVCTGARDLILEFEFLSLQSCDVEVVVAGMAQLILYFPIEIAVTPLQRLDVAFSRHDNSFPLASDDSIVTKNTRLVDVARVQHRPERGKPSAKSGLIALV
jgi:hypothetical protein